jgi:peptide/nickel transport system permease protein
MIKYIIRRIYLLLITMVMVSIAVFLIVEASPGHVARKILGPFVTPEQEASFLAQNGLDKPVALRYFLWLFGSDWYAAHKSGLQLERITTEDGFQEWWASDADGRLRRWEFADGNLVTLTRMPDQELGRSVDNALWRQDKEGRVTFWGVDTRNHLVLWDQNAKQLSWKFNKGSWSKQKGAPVEYIPLQKGFLRGDPGLSLMTGRPVSQTIMTMLRNSLFLAGLTFVTAMPLAILLGILAGIKEGSRQDRTLSIFGMIFAVIPEFVTGVFLIIIFSLWLEWLPGAAVFGLDAPWTRLDMLVLPVLTLALVELGYVLRITRASMVEVMRAPYIRTARLSGIPYWQVIFGHAVRNAIIAPITIVMLHFNWLLGGIVVVEYVFGYPGLGKYLLDAALMRDINAITGGAMIMVVVSVSTQLIADIVYPILNPRIRYT